MENIGPNWVNYMAETISGLCGPHGLVGPHGPALRALGHFYCLTIKVARVARDDCGPTGGSVSMPRPQTDRK